MQRTLSEAADYICTTLRAFGVDESGLSRISQMKTVFENRDFIPDTDCQFEQACEALRDIRLLAFACDALVGQVSKDVLQRKLQRLVKDSVLPQDDSLRTPGRDTQAELYIAGVCQAAGMAPSFEEPDIIVTVGNAQYSIAVKRLKRIQSLEKRFRGAASQIEGAGIPGIIALDMVMALNPHNWRIWAELSDADIAKAHTVAMEHLADEYYDRFKLWQRGREIRGVVLLDHVVRREAGAWGLDSFTYYVPLCSDNQRRRREAKEFWRAYSKGIPNPVLSGYMTP